MLRAASIFVVFFLSNMLLHGQNIPQDTLSNDPLKKDKKSSFTTIFYGQPGKAALYSLIIPGGGQVYNRRYWKVPIIYAGEGYAMYHLVRSLRSFKKKDTCWKSLVRDSANPHSNCNGETSISNSFTLRQNARAQKETAWIIMSAAHLLNVVEAFVDRHLINFDVSEDISYHNMPEITNHIDVNQSIDIKIISVRIPLWTE
jgi:hypothetical protein